MKLIIKNKITLQSPDKKILIFDKSGLCYIFENSEGIHRFNLPKGIYKTTNNVKKSDRVLDYKLPELPTPEGMREYPEKFTIKFAVNKNKCSVYPKTGLVIFDFSFKNKPRFILQYVLLHELGHYLYFGNGNLSEMKCDTFANHYMIKMGYNPSQCFIANQFILSDKQVKRKILNHLINRKNGYCKS